MRRPLRLMLALGIGTTLWVPIVHLPFRALAGRGRGDRLLERQMDLWGRPAEAPVESMRRVNPEWDFMTRSFVAWALCNRALVDPGRAAEYLAVVDAIDADTRRRVEVDGPLHFLLPYAGHGRWAHDPPRSLFVDGELALTLGLRRLVADDPDLRAVHHALLDRIALQMSAGPIASGESYPDECWTFCNTVALAALRVADAVDGTARSAPIVAAWLAGAREHLFDPATGLLVSRYRLDGRVMEGPEGTTIWMVAHCLQFVDDDLARSQYDLARRELGRSLIGFGYAREWPPSWVGGRDVDSGSVVPWLEASAGGSGMALIGARAFGDDEFALSLATSLEMAAFPHDGGYAAAAGVGEAVFLYAESLGPATDLVRRRLEVRR